MSWPVANPANSEVPRTGRPPAAPEPQKSQWHLSAGDQIAPGRTAVKRLGGGLRYEAYLAWDAHLHALVVIKILRPGLVEDRHALEGLAVEARMLELLRHPVLVRGFGAELEGSRPHIVLEHLEGPRLSTMLRKYGPLPVEQLIPLALQLCSVAHYMGAEGILHLDIKPSNIIMGAPARLIDLSVAKALIESGGIRNPIGTDAFMAPEQCDPQGRGPAGPAADVWGIGATLFRAASGSRPFPGADHHSAVPEERWPQLASPPIPLPEKVPPEIAEPILACLTADPAARPSATELAARLEPILDALPKPRLSKLKPRMQRA